MVIRLCYGWIGKYKFMQIFLRSIFFRGDSNHDQVRAIM